MEFEETNVKEGESADFGTRVQRRNVIRWAAAAVLGGVLGYAAVYLLPPKWEATTLIRIGKVHGKLHRTAAEFGGAHQAAVVPAARGRAREYVQE